MVFQYGKNQWNLHYVPVLKSLLDNPEGIDLEQMASLTEIQKHELQEVLLNSYVKGMVCFSVKLMVSVQIS